MRPQTFERRVESLEQRVTVLEQVPARMDHLAAQISQLRDEMRVEFSAFRNDVVAGDEETRRIVSDQLRATAEEIMAQARRLHEDALSRIALMGEGQPSQRGRKKRR